MSLLKERHLNYGNKYLQKFYYKNSDKNGIFEKKKYMEKRCHMIGPYHYQAKLGRVGEAFTLFA